MIRFDRSQYNALRTFLSASYVHDAQIEKFNYDHDVGALYVYATNHFYRRNYRFSFLSLKSILFVKNHQFGSYETINSLTVEDNTTLTESPIYIADNQHSQYLYLLFQLISGDEIHIVSREVIIEEEKKESGSGDGFHVQKGGIGDG